jgi:hypothetical protein
MDEKEDPRGVAAPPDPHAGEKEGVGRGGHYSGSTREADECERCGETITPENTYCQRCRTEKDMEEHGHKDTPTEHSGLEPITRTSNGIGVAVVEANLDLVATAKGKAALKNRADMPDLPVGAEKHETVDGVDDIDGEPHEVLQDDWPPLKEAVELSSSHGEQIAGAALENHDPEESVAFYDETGKPLKDISTISDLESVVDEGEVWLVPGFLYELDREQTGESTADSKRRNKAKKPKMMQCVRCGEKTTHIHRTVDDGMNFWECRDCNKWRPGPSPDDR